MSIPHDPGNPYAPPGAGGGTPQGHPPPTPHPAPAYPHTQYPQTPHPQTQYPQTQYPQTQYGPPPRRSTGRVVAAVLGAVALVLLLVVGGLALLGARSIEAEQHRSDDRDVRTALRNASLAQEYHAVERDGSYTTDLADLADTGVFVPDPSIEVVIVSADTGPRGMDGYCLSARHVDGGPTLWLSTQDDGPAAITTEPCD